MESVDSDEGSSNAPKHKPAPQKKIGVQRQQKRGPGRPRKHPSPSDPDKKKALQPRGGITKVSAMLPLALAEHTPSPPPCYPLFLLLPSFSNLLFSYLPFPLAFLPLFCAFIPPLCIMYSTVEVKAVIAADSGLCKALHLP